jgi:hypothetical protein
VREERVVLEHGVDASLVGRRRGDIVAGDEDAAFIGLLETCNEPQRRGLAAAGRTEE